MKAKAVKPSLADLVKKKVEETAPQLKKLFSMDDNDAINTAFGDVHDDLGDYQTRLEDPVLQERPILVFDDIDLANAHDPQMVPEYAAEIFQYLREKEVCHHLSKLNNETSVNNIYLACRAPERSIPA